MPGPGGHHGGPGGPGRHGGHHGGPGGFRGGHRRPPIGGGMWHRPPRRTGCCGCLFPVIGLIGVLIGAMILLF